MHGLGMFPNFEPPSFHHTTNLWMKLSVISNDKTFKCINNEAF